MPIPRLRGEVKILPLATVKPNTWNPNTMTPEMKASLRHGLSEDGWLASQALLIWGSDEMGEPMNIIIDGEHRFVEAVGLGMVDGPMVVLDLLSEAEAKALTIKMNQKRGDWNVDGLAGLLKELSMGSDAGITGLDFGFTDESLMKLLADAPLDMGSLGESSTTPTLPSSGNTTSSGEGTDGAAPPGGSTGTPPAVSSVRMVQLFLDDKTHPPFMEQIAKLSEAWGTSNVTDTVLRAVAEAALASQETP